MDYNLVINSVIILVHNIYIMSVVEDKSEPISESTHMPVETAKPEHKPTLQETIIRDEEATKKCCNVVKSDVHICFRCCTYSWACSLNSIECCCGALSELCLIMSKCAIGCKNCLEQIDCDGH